MFDALAIETRTTTRTRRLRVTVYPGGRIVLSRPRWVSERGAARFLKTHEEWILRQSERMRTVVVPETRMRGSRRDYLARKENARTLVHAKLAHFAPRYGMQYGRVAIKNMTSRWGSCSHKGNLNFHYKVVDLSPELVDYLVVHELCHLKEMNHGARFWELVAKEIPAYRTLRKRLRAEC
jgi:predicted metal-dependent hydrolase